MEPPCPPQQQMSGLKLRGDQQSRDIREMILMMPTLASTYQPEKRAVSVSSRPPSSSDE